ncbi:MAG: hypothetical protein ABR559_05970, partial [Gemmatimonadota bacterium]
MLKPTAIPAVPGEESAERRGVTDHPRGIIRSRHDDRFETKGGSQQLATISNQLRLMRTETELHIVVGTALGRV